MRTDEVVPSEVECDGSLQVRPLLAEPVRKPGESALVRPERRGGCVNTFLILFALVSVLAALYVFGFLPKAGIVRFYQRVRLALLLWVTLVLGIGLLRMLDIL